MTPFQMWLMQRMEKAGGYGPFMRLAGISSGRLTGWVRGALPLDADLVTGLAGATGEDERRLRDLIWDSLRQRKTLAPEVASPARSFRPRRRPGAAAQAAPAGRSQPSTGRGSSEVNPRQGEAQRPITRTPVKSRRTRGILSSWPLAA